MEGNYGRYVLKQNKMIHDISFLLRSFAKRLWVVGMVDFFLLSFYFYFFDFSLVVSSPSQVIGCFLSAEHSLCYPSELEYFSILN